MKKRRELTCAAALRDELIFSAKRPAQFGQGIARANEAVLTCAMVKSSNEKKASPESPREKPRTGPRARRIGYTDKRAHDPTFGQELAPTVGGTFVTGAADAFGSTIVAGGMVMTLTGATGV